MYSKGMLLYFLFMRCYAVSNETSRFLNENSFGNLEPRFVDQEVEVRQIPAIPDHLLIELGARQLGQGYESDPLSVIGGESDFSFDDLDIVCFIILLPISAPARW